MMELPYLIQTCFALGEVLLQYLVSLFLEMMIQEDPPMM